MRFSFDHVREGPISWEESLEVDASSLELPELLELSAIECCGEATAAAPGMRLLAEVGYRQVLRCDRCLERFEQAVATELDLLALPAQRPPASPAEVELDEQDLGVIQVAGDEVETEPLVVEQVVLNVPMKPLCRPDCAGLCPRCGSNLNEGHCGCERSEPDPRWAALADWRDRRI